MLIHLVDKDNIILKTKTTDIEPENIIKYKDFINEMFNFIESKNGIGLSAPQVGVDKSLFVISIDNVRKVFINPKIISVSGKKSIETEGCLSLPGLNCKIERPETITITWLDENNTTQIADLEALWARCWLHEYDHLQGILITDRISKLKLNILNRKLNKQSKKNKQSK